MAGDNSSRCGVVGINQLPPAAIPHLFRSFGQSYNVGHHDRCQNTVAKRSAFRGTNESCNLVCNFIYVADPWQVVFTLK